MAVQCTRRTVSSRTVHITYVNKIKIKFELIIGYIHMMTKFCCQMELLKYLKSLVETRLKTASKGGITSFAEKPE